MLKLRTYDHRNGEPMTKIALKYSLFLAIALQLGSLSAYMQPIQKEGKYYYCAQDTHKHIDLKKALSFLRHKIISPSILSP